MFKIVTICGSMRFIDEMEKEAKRLTELECEITNLISRLQSESPSQTPSP